MLVQIFVDEKIVGNIFQEFPELYPNDWTLTAETIKGDLVSTLNSCIEAALWEIPNCKIILTEE